MLEEMVEKGANPLAKDKAGNNLLHACLARKSGVLEVLEFLDKYGVSIDENNLNGAQAVERALDSGISHFIDDFKQFNAIKSQEKQAPFRKISRLFECIPLMSMCNENNNDCFPGR